MAKYIGCDLGGTNIKAGIVDSDTGEIIGQKSIPTLARDGHDAVMQRMADLILALTAENGLRISEIGAVGIGLPGKLDMDKGEVLFLTNLPGNWPHVPVEKVISEKVGLPVAIMNDVRAITYGEWKFGAGQGVDTMVCFALGTGVGGGSIINGRLHLGIGGSAGELGHMVIDLNGAYCGCGNRGCLETYCSGPAITSAGLRAVTQGMTTQIGELVGYDMNKITPEIVSRAALMGDEIARQIYDQAGYALGIGIGNILVSICPRKVVIGGGVAAAGDLLLEPARRAVREYAHVVPVDQVEIVLAKLGTNAGVIGTALWASEKVK